WAKSADRVTALEGEVADIDTRTESLEEDVADLAASYRYRGALTDPDIATVTDPGTYYLQGTITGLPSDWISGDPALLRVESFGPDTSRTLVSHNNTKVEWRKKNSEAWEKTLFSGATTVADFKRDYAYRSVLSTGSIDTLVDEGRYLATTGA